MPKLKRKERHVDSFSQQLPAVSARVKIILSNRKDSHKLAKAVRAYRNGNSIDFSVSEESMHLLED